MSDAVELLEFTRISKAREVDEEKGILFDIVALGPESENNRDYPEDTQRAALGLFEGARSYANHLKGAGEPSVYDALGVWNEMRVDGGRTRGNFHYFKSHPLAGRLVEAARRPELGRAFGFSINARGTERRGANGRNIIESITRLNSIDLVAQPATTKGLYESKGGEVAKLTVQDIQEALKDKRPKYSAALREMAEAGILSPGAPMDDPGATPGEGDHEQAIRDAMKACIDDPKLSIDEVIKKIKLLDKARKGGKGDGAPPPAEEEDEETPAASEEDDVAKQESVELKAKLARLEARERLRSAADDANVKLPMALVESVRDDLTADQAKALVAGLKTGGHGGNKPRSAAPQQGAARAGGVQESKQQAAGGVPEDRKERAAWLNGKG